MIPEAEVASGLGGGPGPAVAALGPLAQRIEHVSSTAVPGLAAKPIIDIDVVIAARGDPPAVTARLRPSATSTKATSASWAEKPSPPLPALRRTTSTCARPATPPWPATASKMILTPGKIDVFLPSSAGARMSVVDTIIE